MKKFVFLLSFILAVSLVFATPNYDGEITVGTDQNPTTMDPALYQDLASAQVMRNVFETLVAYDASVKEIKPLIAESWEVSEDLKVWTFKLKKGVHFQKGKFQNGREVTAEDVKYSFEREIEISPMVRLYMVDKVEVLDKYTVKITLKYPFAPFLTVLTDIGAAIVPKEEAEGWGDEFTLHPVGTGPFKMVEWIKDDHMTFIRNDDYWGEEKPYLKKVTYKFIPNKSVLAVALMSGEVDIASDILDQDIPKVKANSNVDVIMVPGVNVYAVYMNSMRGPTVDKKVREAIFRAVDTDQIIKVLFPNGSGVRAYGPIPPGSWAYNPDIKELYPSYDPEKAKQLLKEAGYDNNLSLTIYTPEDPNRRKAAIVMQSMLKKIGVDLKVQSLEWGSFVAITSKGDADMYTIGWTWYPDPEYFIFYMFHSSRKGTYGNGGGYNNPKVDELIAKGESTADKQERIKYYQEAEKLIMKDMVYMPLYHKMVVMGVNKKVKGFTVSPDMMIRLYAPGTNIWIEK
ncbi:MAG: peptide/nickel transport system substrate-binding protein [Thermotogaceae bacterium]|nr:peptide/nickel transport system substrate-binding protein [Thermotogaceae bacterium]MDN5338506.1 peptide/nickel transport system substrate-binding protein [Thermotogaceae bacterium]